MKVYVTGTVDWKRFVNRLICSATAGDYAHALTLFVVSESELDEVCLNAPRAGYLIDRLHETEDRLRVHDDGNYWFYMESIAAKDKYTGKSGLRGPYDYRKLSDWQQRDSENRHIKRIEMTQLDKREKIQMLEFLAVNRQLVKYPLKQIKWNWLTSRLRLGIPPNARTPHRWDCSETVVRAIAHVAPDMASYRLKLGDWLFDEYAPSSGKRSVPGVLEMLESKD